MSEKEKEKKIETSPNYAKIYLIKCQNLERTIKKQENEIKKLSFELLQANKDKEDLKTVIRTKSSSEEQLKYLEEEMRKECKQYQEMIEKRDKDLSRLTRQMSEFESKTNKEKSELYKKIDLYDAKIETLKALQKDNEAYKDEIETLKKDHAVYKAKVEEELKIEKKNNLFKISNFKQKMIDSLKQTNENMKDFNYEFMGANNKLLQRQNQQLFLQIDKKNDIIKDLHKQIKILRDLLYENEKDMDIHKLVEYNLAQKLIEKGLSPSKDIKYRTKNVFNSSQSSLPNLKKNQSESEILSKSNNKEFIKINKRKSNLLRSNSVDESENYSLTQKMTYNIEKKTLNYQKEIKEKNIEIEKEQLINVQLRNKLNVYKSKFKGLVNFLEESLDNFSKDQKLMAKTNFNTKIEKIKKCEFEEFTIEEKKELLRVLIKYLLPLANPDIDSNWSNDSRTYFNTNLSITKLKNMNNKHYLNDNILKKAFVNKASKFHKDILNGRTLIFSSSKHDTIEQ
jgi:hypothetical protein